MAVGYLVYGPPNEFPDPGVDAPFHSADDPHAAALILRTCLLMKKNGIGSNNDALILRSWQYLEMMWRTTGEMAYTWSPYPDDRVWYAHMHGEIIETLVQCIKLSAYLPGSVPLATVKQRLLQTTIWLKTRGVENAAPGLFDVYPYRDYDVLLMEPNRVENLETVYARVMEEYDDRRAFPVRYDPGGYSFPTHKFVWLLDGHAARNDFYRFIYHVRGRQKSFWVPTWCEDFVMLDDIPVNGTTMKVSNAGAAAYGLDAKNCHVVIIQNTPTGYAFTYRQITNVAALDEETETLTLDNPIYDGITKKSVAMVCFMYLARLDNDLIEIKHITDQVATVATVMKAIWEIRHV